MLKKKKIVLRKEKEIEKSNKNTTKYKGKRVDLFYIEIWIFFCKMLLDTFITYAMIIET